MENINETISRKEKKNPYVKWTILFFVLIGLTLPFHYIPSRMMVFPKDHLTFSHTLITEDYIESIIERHNNANLLEKLSIKQEPVVRLLVEKRIIKDDVSENDAVGSYRAGLLQKFSKKGSIFNTFKGELILFNVNSTDSESNPLQSEKFIFEVTDSDLAIRLESLQGKNVVVHTIIKHGTFPWQEDEINIVDSVKDAD